MGKILVLAEKPSVGKELARVLGCHEKGQGCFTGPRYIVTWALGHLVTLADPEHYGEKYKSWKLDDLPMLPARMDLVVIKDTGKQFQVVKSLMQSSEVDELVLATDAGREGELVGRWIMEKVGWRKPLKRLWISSQTDKAIKEGFAALKPGRDYDNLYHAAVCRAEADWLIGLNVTRALTCKFNAQLSAGRVQTPTLAMIVAREEEIAKFVPKEFWTVQAKTKGFALTWQDKKTGQSRIFDKSQAEKILTIVKGQNGEIIEVHKELKKEPPPLAYDLTELQRDANRRHGLSAKETSEVMQALYERHKLLTYPRTDSRYLSSDIVPTIPERLKSMASGPYTAMVQGVLKNKIVPGKRLVDDSKVSDHHAIIPTEQPLRLGALSPRELKVYDLVARRFLAVLSEPFIYEQTTVKASVAGEIFTARGRIVQSKGWKAVYDGQDNADEENNTEQEEVREQFLPQIKKGDKVSLDSVQLHAGKTKPPARYTEATLLSAMEHPGKFIENEAMREVMESVSGLGTPATRAEIIERLFSAFYIERKGKEIFPTTKGIQLIGLVPPDLKSPELTAKWEEQLIKISRGQSSSTNFIADMKGYATRLVSTVVTNTDVFRHENITRNKCPQCGKNLLDVQGKKGKMLVCQDRECGYRRGVSIVSNARCPECHKKMELRGEGDNKLFTCACGYREKLETFQNRRGQDNGVPGKREVGRYLREQEEKPINAALAEALSQWKKNAE